jgi:hypothetical protein
VDLGTADWLHDEKRCARKRDHVEKQNGGEKRLHDWPPLASVAWNAPALNNVAETERDAFHLG